MILAAVRSCVAVVAMSCALADAQFIIAHRGASHDAPENTLAAFNLAWEQEADGIEADFHLTSDGKIICSHDADTQRTANVRHVIKDTTFEELQALEVGSWKHEKFRGERMPTFKEVMATVPEGKLFFIELKTGPEIVSPLMEIPRNSPLNNEQIVIISFNDKTIAECERQWPELRTHWLVRYEQEQEDKPWTPTRQAVEKTLGAIKTDGLATQANREYVDAAFLKKLCENGWCEFSVWTVDKPKIARFYQELGTWSITTNRPGYIRSELWSEAEPTATPTAAAPAR